MTDQRTMNSIIHAAFRRDLGRFDGALGSFPAGSGGRAVQLKAAWDHLAYQLQGDPASSALHAQPPLGRRGHRRRIAGAWSR